MKTVQDLEIEHLTEKLEKQQGEISDLREEIKVLRQGVAAIQAAIGWVIAAATGIGGVIVALRSGLIKWLAGVE